MVDLHERPPCPVCGTPGGNCGHADGTPDPAPDPLLFNEWAGTDRPTRSSKPPTKEPVMGDVVAKEKVWERVPIPNAAGRTRRVLRFSSGEIVPEEDAKRLHVGANGKQGTIPTAKVASDAVVPLAGRKRPAKKAAKARKARKR